MIPASLQSGPAEAAQVDHVTRAITNFGPVEEVKPPRPTKSKHGGAEITSSWHYERPHGRERVVMWDFRDQQSAIIITKRDDVIGRDGKPIRIRPNIAPLDYSEGNGWVNYEPGEDGQVGRVIAVAQKQRDMRNNRQIMVHWLLGDYPDRWVQRGKPDPKLLAEEWEWGRQLLFKPWLLFHLEEALQGMLSPKGGRFHIGWEQYNIGGRLTSLVNQITEAESRNQSFQAKRLMRFHDEATAELERMSRMIRRGREILAGMQDNPKWEPSEDWAVDELRMAVEWKTGDEPDEDTEPGALLAMWNGTAPKSDKPDESWSLTALQKEAERVTGEPTRDRSKTRLLAKIRGA